MSRREGLEYTGILAGGFRQDIHRRWPHYRSDFGQGLHSKVVGSVFFLFFACLANAIAFGALTGAMTGGEIGIVEMLIATAFGGIVYSLFSGQPLTLLGGTGPIVIFTALLYELCKTKGIPFLPMYAWVGMWSGGFLVLCALTDLSFLMRFFTRFTDEIFSVLIALIFILEAVRHLFVPVFNGSAGQTQLLGIILGLGTYQIARNLKGIGKTPYLRHSVREFIADFGPAIAIMVMTFSALLFPKIPLDLPLVPTTIEPSVPRAWIVNMADLPLHLRFYAAFPALLVSILLFLDQNITTRLVNSPQNRLKKGSGFHLDLCVVGLITCFTSVFGLPWIVAATVHSLNHVRSLADVRPGNEAGKEVIVHVRENRVSGLFIHLLMASSLLFLGFVDFIPLPVLYGLFLFMGLTTLQGNQMFERLKLWVMDPTRFPRVHYIRSVPLKSIHKFTLIQLICLMGLWGLKVSKWGILFPLFIAALVPVRMFLSRWFKLSELRFLDSDEEDSEDLLV